LPRKQKETTNIVFIPKRTTIGRGKIGFSTMNKHKRRSYKKYRGQVTKMLAFIKKILGIDRLEYQVRQLQRKNYWREKYNGSKSRNY